MSKKYFFKASIMEGVERMRDYLRYQMEVTFFELMDKGMYKEADDLYEKAFEKVSKLDEDTEKISCEGYGLKAPWDVIQRLKNYADEIELIKGMK